MPLTPLTKLSLPLRAVLSIFILLWIAGQLFDSAHTPPPPAPAPPAASLSPTTPLHHLVVATRHKPGLDLLLLSARSFGYRSTVLGRNDSRPLGHWDKAFGLKLLLIRDAVAALPPRDWVIFTDAYDALFQRAAGDLVAALEAREAADAAHALLFTAETYEWPDGGRPYTTRTQHRLPYLNSGVYAGRAGSLAASLADGFTLETDDQRFFTTQYFDRSGRKPGVAIDHGAKFFVCLAGLERSEYELGWRRGAGGKAAAAAAAPVVRLTEKSIAGAEPFVVHLNGNIGKAHMYRVAAHLFGDAGARLAEIAQWDGSVTGYVLWPFILLSYALLPWRARSALSDAGVANEAVVALSILVAALSVWATIEVRGAGFGISSAVLNALRRLRRGVIDGDEKESV